MRLPRISAAFFVSLLTSNAAEPSQIRHVLDEMRAGKHVDEALGSIDLTTFDIANETSAIMSAVTGSDQDFGRRAVGIAIAAIAVRPMDTKLKRDARSILPSLVSRYDEPDPPEIRVPSDSWRQTIMYLLIHSDAVVSPELVAKIKADLDSKDEKDGSTRRLAGVTLTLLRPIPDGVIESMLARMESSDRAKVEVITIFGESKVDDQRVVQAVTIALESHALGDPEPEGVPVTQNTTLHPNNRICVAAAQALGNIGASAKDALPALRSIAAGTDRAVEESTRQAARRAFR